MTLGTLAYLYFHSYKKKYYKLILILLSLVKVKLRQFCYYCFDGNIIVLMNLCINFVFIAILEFSTFFRKNVGIAKKFWWPGHGYVRIL